MTLPASQEPRTWKEILDRPWWADYLFDRFKWYRRICGGHWELWWNDVTHSHMWYQVTRCSEIEPKMRPACCYCKPYCEEFSQ